MFYSPFTDEKGNMLTLNEINFSHLSQLNEKGIEEGFSIEFKSLFDDNFKKKHLCQKITSFANSDGGWLFVGIQDNGNVSCINVENTDFSVTITNCLKSNVSPLPVFYSRTLINPTDSTKCVLVIYIPASRNTPYICNGTIYVRNGSNSLPVKDRATIDELYNRRDGIYNWINNFCNCTIYESFPIEFPYCYVYLFNPESDIKLSAKQLDDLCSLTNDLDNINLSNRATNSVIFYNANTTDVTSFIEYFDDHNIKLGFPMIPVNQVIDSEFKESLYKCNINAGDFKIFDAYNTTENISLVMKNVFQILAKFNKDVTKYSMIFEFYNVENSFMLFLDQKVENLKFFNEKGFRFCRKKNIRSRDWSILNSYANKKPYEYTMSIANLILGNTFGYTLNEFVHFYSKSRKNYKNSNINVNSGYW